MAYSDSWQQRSSVGWSRGSAITTTKSRNSWKSRGKIQIEGYKIRLQQCPQLVRRYCGKFNNLHDRNGVNEGWRRRYPATGTQIENPNLHLGKQRLRMTYLADINTVDDLLEGWQGSYDADKEAHNPREGSTLTSLLSNWSDAEVAAADRGHGRLHAAHRPSRRRPRRSKYAGTDLALAGTTVFSVHPYETMAFESQLRRRANTN